MKLLLKTLLFFLPFIAPVQAQNPEFFTEYRPSRKTSTFPESPVSSGLLVILQHVWEPLLFNPKKDSGSKPDTDNVPHVLSNHSFIIRHSEPVPDQHTCCQPIPDPEQGKARQCFGVDFGVDQSMTKVMVDTSEPAILFAQQVRRRHKLHQAISNSETMLKSISGTASGTEVIIAGEQKNSKETPGLILEGSYHLVFRSLIASAIHLLIGPGLCMAAGRKACQDLTSGTHPGPSSGKRGAGVQTRKPCTRKNALRVGGDNASLKGETPGIIIKQETVVNAFAPHRYSDDVPLFLYKDDIVKQEYERRAPISRNRLLFSPPGLNPDFKKEIKKSIRRYIIDLNDEERTQYLNERVGERIYSGDIIGLNGQKEVHAKRSLEKAELIGHYGGVITNEKKTDCPTKTGRYSRVDQYAFRIDDKVFIDGFRSSNILSLVNAPTVYNKNESVKETANIVPLIYKYKGRPIVFFIASEPIEKDQSLWLDYGKQYWDIANQVIEISDDEVDEGADTRITDNIEGADSSDPVSSGQSAAVSTIPDIDNRKKHTCHYCGRCFNHKSHMTVHTRIHTGERPYKCRYCNKPFMRASHLTGHLRIHTGERPFKCTYCSKSFRQSGQLKEHLCIHTGERPYKCTQCGKGFIKLDNLKRHSFTHTGNKPFKCTQCEKCFTMDRIRKRHEVMHGREKSFKCTQCGKGFMRDWDRKRHEFIHSKEPFKCTQCGKCFPDKRNMIIHQKYIHRKRK